MSIHSWDIRSKYLEFFRQKQHAVIESAPLVPENDPSVLFNTAGMQPLVPYLLGKKHPMGTRLADVQKCIRTVDIDDVGDNTHCTFFEMLGNWSLGDYFKEASIQWSHELLTSSEWLGIDPSWLAVTVFEGDENAPRDEESATIWRQLGIPESRISYLPAEDNWWAAGPTGPCGPDTEIFYWVGEGEPDPESNVAKDPKKWMEIWNNVFMEYNRKKTEKVLLLDGMHCLFDENLGVDEAVLSRARALSSRIIVVTMVSRDALSHLADIGLEVISYDFDPPKTNPDFFKKLLSEKSLSPDDVVYIDHAEENLKSARDAGITNCELFEAVRSFDKLEKYLYTLEKLPAQNVDTGMGLERITATLGHVKSVYETDIFADVLEKIRTIVWANNYHERSARIIADHLRAATHLVADGVVPKNVDQGYILRRLIRRAIREFFKMGYEERIIAEIARMYIAKFRDVYQSVRDNETMIIEELQKEEERFAKTLKNGLRELEKTAEPITGKVAFDLFQTYGLPPEMIEEELSNLGRPPFDRAEFDREFEHHQAISRAGSEQKFKGGLADTAVETVRLHSATHLLLSGLRHVLGDHVHQAGANITTERLRFDFTHPEKLTDEQKSEIEQFVNDAIQTGFSVTIEEMPKQTARETGVEWSFWERYPEIVSVYTMQSVDGTIYSRELCGGPHVEISDRMGTFRITKEESSSAGVRRVKAVLE